MFRRLILILPATLLIAGCGDTTIDTGKAEDFIRTAVVEQVGAEVKAVDCPAEVEPQAGATFTCEVTGADGTTGTATVTQKDDEGNVKVDAPFLHTPNVEELVSGQLAERIGSEVSLACPDIVPGEKGATFECEATAGSETTTVEVTQRDAEGNVRWEIAG